MVALERHLGYCACQNGTVDLIAYYHMVLVLVVALDVVLVAVFSDDDNSLGAIYFDPDWSDQDIIGDDCMNKKI